MKTKLLGLVLGIGAVLCCGNAFAEPECVTQYGTTVCGYNCVASYGEVKCSRTPQGVCEASYGKVVCWDPAEHVRQKAECVASYGDIACGYNCVASYGVVKCSRTPQGACEASYGQVVCWDPSVRTKQKAECISSYGSIACGYNCASGYGEVKCARTPNGICKADAGSVTCWDP